MPVRTSTTVLSQGIDGRLYMPLHKLFDAPGHIRDKTWIEKPAGMEPPRNPRYENLRTAMERHGPLSLAPHEKGIPSSWELYYRAAAVRKYYPLIAEQVIADNNCDDIASILSGSVLVELGCGDMRKTIKLLKKMPLSARPKQIYCVDIIKDNVDASIKALIEIGYTDDQLMERNADIVKDEFWGDLSDELYEKMGSPKTVFLLQGATYNNFERDQMVALLANAHRIPGDTTFLYAIDNTTDYHSLKAGYETVEMQHLLLSAAEPHFHKRRKMEQIKHRRRILGLSTFDHLESGIKGATADISVKPYGPFQSVFFSVISGDYLFSAIPENYKHRIDFVPIQKIPAEIKKTAMGEEIGGEMGRMFREAQVSVFRRMRFNSPDFPNVDYSLYAIRPRLSLSLNLGAPSVVG